MLQHKTYMDIMVMNDEFKEDFSVGDRIIIEEKLDGANASFQYDSKNDVVLCFSRNKQLDERNNLRGFYDWVQKQDKNRIHTVLGNNLRVFGEWLVKHTVKYPDECLNNLYIFDVFDMERHIYLPQSEAKEIADRLGIPFVPIFFDGEFKSWEDITPLIGKTAMGGEIGEGIVIKNMTKLNSSTTNKVVYTKLVHERFSEVFRKSRERRKENAEQRKVRMQGIEMTERIVTPARIEKILNKLVDEGILPENYSLKEMQIICKNLPSAVYYDCMKEEPEIVNSVDNFGKHCGAVSLKHAKEIVARRSEHE